MKLLIIRFSSIGDIILTTPVIRCVKEQLGAEVHFLLKKNFASVLSGNPYIDKKHLYDTADKSLIEVLKAEKFDQIIDLHKNIRSKRLIAALGVKASSFEKLNIQKWLMTSFKIDILPRIHIVDRYFKAVEKLKIINDQRGLDFFVKVEDETSVSKFLSDNGILPNSRYITIAIGSAQKTKVPPLELYSKIIQELDIPVILLGGPGDEFFGNQIKGNTPNKWVINAAGKFTLAESVACIKHSACLITPDTGLMHAGTAVGTPLIVIWGNTIPEFGMYPYFKPDQNLFFNQEVKGLSCRPCSKIGYKQCPKGHFRCMRDQNIPEIIERVNFFVT